jgi:hypothetical protein
MDKIGCSVQILHSNVSGPDESTILDCLNDEAPLRAAQVPTELSTDHELLSDPSICTQSQSDATSIFLAVRMNCEYDPLAKLLGNSRRVVHEN